MNGWIKIDRSIQDHWIWQDAAKLKCWVALLLNASHSNQKVLIGHEIVECRRGQIVGSLRQIGEIVGMGKDAVRSTINVFHKQGMILLQTEAKFTRITICNYESYQGVTHDVQTDSRQTADNDKNVKNEKKNVIDKKAKDLFHAIDVDKFSLFWEKYGKKEGKSLAQKSWKKLSEAEKDKVLETVDAYVAWKSDVQYRKMPATYLNQKCFNDEIPATFAAPQTELTRNTYTLPTNAIL